MGSSALLVFTGVNEAVAGVGAERRGYTLIEVVISTLIISFLVGGGVAAYTRFDSRQKVVSAGRAVVVDLRDTQKRAQSGDKPQSGCGTLDGWSFRQVNSSEYAIAATCDSDPNPVSSSETRKSLGSDISFGQGSFEYVFEVLTGKVGVTGPTTLSITNGGNDYVYDVRVSRFGAVDDLGVR